MPYRVRTLPQVARQIQRWPMPDVVLVDVYLRLDLLTSNPAERLSRETTPFDGMVYRFSLIDPTNELCVHTFLFHAVYGQDEETLWIVHGVHNRFTLGV
jgi:hypothetical protein